MRTEGQARTCPHQESVLRLADVSNVDKWQVYPGGPDGHTGCFSLVTPKYQVLFSPTPEMIS